jgi:hypothetical protein
MHGICDCRVVVSLDVRTEGCNGVLGEVELAVEDNFAGGGGRFWIPPQPPVDY